MRTILVAAVLLAGFALPLAPASARVPARFVGVSADGPLLSRHVSLNGELRLMVRSGVTSVRTTWSWAAAQPYRSFEAAPASARSRYADSGGVPTDFSAFDRMVGATAAHGLTLMPVVLYSPSWDASNVFNPALPPADPQPFARFVAALARRYGPDGDYWRTHPRVPRMPIRDWQIWNEPNIKFYWPVPYAGGYTDMLRATYAELKAVDPGSRLVLAGLTNDAWNALTLLYQAGAKPYFDALALDPYVRRVRELRTELRYVRGVTARYHDARKPLIVSEFSWPSARGHIPRLRFNEVTEAQQVERVSSALELLASLRRRYRIESAYWYTWLSKDRGTYYFDYAGLRKLRHRRAASKPALAAFRRTALRLEGCRAKRRPDRCAR